MPWSVGPAAMDDFIRDGVTTIWHQSRTAKMGQDDMSVVDSRLKVYGIDRLRIADACVMPRAPGQHHGPPQRHHRRASK